MRLRLPSRLPDWVAQALLVLIVVQLGWMGGQWTWRLLWSEPPVAGPVSGAHRSAQAVNGSLAGLTFFGEPERSGQEGDLPAVVRQTARETSLQLTLHGVNLSAQPERSGAIVARDGRDSGYYKVGDELPGAAELVAVEPNRILLRRAGEVESLSFEDDALEVAARSDASGRADVPQDTEAFLDMASERLEEDPEGALAEVGLRVQRGAPGYVFDGTNEQLAQANLRQGDRVLSINGHELGDVERDRELMQEWARASSLRVEIERAGTTFTFTVPVPQQ